MRCLVSSPALAESLARVDFKDIILEKDATENLDLLKYMVERNQERDQQRYGRKSNQTYLNRLIKLY